MNGTEKQLKALGYSESEARWRAEVIDTGRRNAQRNADALGLKDGDSTVVQYNRGSGASCPALATRVNGMLTVGGCIPSPGMVRLSEAVPIWARPTAVK